jgi:hypothetical protein
MKFPSLLYSGAPSGAVLSPDVFNDLKLDLLLGEEAVKAMLRLCRAEDIPIRQQLFSELENHELRAHFKLLARDIAAVCKLSEALEGAACDNERNYIFFNLMSAQMRFYRDAAKTPGSSSFLTRFSGFFSKECETETSRKIDEITSLNLPKTDTVRVNELIIQGDKLRIRSDGAETLVSRLRRCASELGIDEGRAGRSVSIKLKPRMINGLATLYPDIFKLLHDFYDEFASFYDDAITAYRSELNFYLEVYAILEKVKAAGMPVCIPAVSQTKRVWVKNARDISLLAKNVTDIVANDISFTQEEPFYYLTGANGGGKTTYLRSVGITLIMFLSGCPLVCDEAEIYPLRCVFTHFPRDERFDGEGRFADEENRVSEILSAQEGDSLVLLNETYSTTSEETAVELTDKLANTLYESGSFGIYITHQHGIAQTRIPFLSVIIDESDANRRTYKIARRRGASGSFAYDVLKKYALTAKALKERFAGKGGDAK